MNLPRPTLCQLPDKLAAIAAPVIAVAAIAVAAIAVAAIAGRVADE